MAGKRGLNRFVDEARVRAAIVAAEGVTSAPIHVSLAPFFVGTVRRTAELAFRKVRLGETAQRNGVLFFVVPSRRRFSVIGDAGAHAALGQAGWDAIAALVQGHFAGGNPTDALVAGIEAIARALAPHFPPLETAAKAPA